MMRVAINFVSGSGDSSGFISVADTFGGEVEYGEYNGVIIFFMILFCSVGCSFVGRIVDGIIVKVFF